MGTIAAVFVNLCAVEAEGGVGEGEVRLLELVDPIAEIVVLLIEREVEIRTEHVEEHHRLYRHDMRITKGEEEAPWIERDEAGLCFRLKRSLPIAPSADGCHFGVDSVCTASRGAERA